jgi:lipoprotein-anchoring transpeptidase ErfK/SrfK
VSPRLVLVPFLLLLSQCAWKKPAPEPPKPAFRIDQDRYALLKPKDARLEINLKAQKAILLDKENYVVVASDISTGKPGHETPFGSFKITEKIKEKRSTLYGRYKDPKTGLDLGPSVDFPAPPKDAVYEGYSMPFWMRLTWDGVGIHVGHVKPGEAVSYGCIRVPAGVQPLIYEKCRVGTPVTIVGAAEGGLQPARAAR